MKGTIRFLLENSLFLIFGAAAALVWANADPYRLSVDVESGEYPALHIGAGDGSYKNLLHLEILRNPYIGVPAHHGPDARLKICKGGRVVAPNQDCRYVVDQASATALPPWPDEDSAEEATGHGDPHAGEKILTLHFLINDILMALFFAIAGKEVWEATLPGGPLSSLKTAATPLIATIGGMAGPAFLYLGGAVFVGQLPELSNGWAIPCATDIAFSYMVARVVFGPGHPAIPFLLLLAIADDALGLIILAVFYPQGPIQIGWMLLPIAAVFMGLAFRRMRVKSFWPYLLVAGTISWVGFAMSGIHPALGLLPIIPTMPHAHVDEGLFNWGRLKQTDTLNVFEHWWKNPVEMILGAFGLLNAGVILSSVGNATWLVLLGLLVGKPLGIWLFGMFAAKGLRLGLPKGMKSRDLAVLGFAAGIGFTVALFVASVAFPLGPVQDAAKMGALASFGAAILTIIAGIVLRVQKVGVPDGAGSPGHGGG